MIVLDLVTSALQRLGVLAEAEVATAAQANDGFVALNDLIDQYKAERLQIYQLLNVTKALTPSQATYSVGLPGGDVPIARPVFIDHAAWIDSSTPNVYHDLVQLTDDGFSALTVPGLTSTIPGYWWYQTTFPLGTLWLWPIPTSPSIFVSLDYQSPIGEFAALTTVVSLPPAYKRMLRSNLAIELAPDYDRQPSPALIRAASESLAVVKRMNSKLTDLSFPADALIGNGGGSWDIRAGP